MEIDDFLVTACLYQSESLQILLKSTVDMTKFKYQLLYKKRG